MLRVQCCAEPCEIGESNDGRGSRRSCNIGGTAGNVEETIALTDKTHRQTREERSPTQEGADDLNHQAVRYTLNVVAVLVNDEE